jgi:hypothetical protein
MVENSWSEILLDKTIPSKITRKIMLFSEGLEQNIPTSQGRQNI